MSDFEYENTGDLPPEEVEKIQAKIEALESVSRKIGLYLDRVAISPLPGPDGSVRKAMMVTFSLGDLAFAARVQDPEQDSVDKKFQEMATDMTNNEFLDTRERMKRNLAAGRDPMDDGDDA